LRQYNLGDFESAIASLEESLKIENIDDSEAWIFLALSLAQTIKPSNFLDKLNAISDAMSHAKNNIIDHELFENSEIQLSSSVIENSADAALFYHRNSTKRFNSSGLGFEQAKEAITILKTSFTFPNHGSNNRVKALILSIEISAEYDSRYGNFLSDTHDFLDQLETLCSSNDLLKTLAEDSFDQYLSSYGRSFLNSNSKLFSQSKPKSKPSVLKSETQDDESEEDKKNQRIGCIAVIITIVLIFYFLG